MNNKLIKLGFPIVFCILVTLIFCYPFLNGSILMGPDTAFHINRIEALSIAMQNNDIFPRLFYHQNFHFGYGSPMFYSIFFLYFPALLRTIGISVFNSYHIFLFVCTFLASFSMYQCAKLFIGKKKTIYICITVMFYIWNCYYMSDLYKRGAIGEVLAFVFIPIIIMGMYHSVYGDYKKHYILVIGFCGLLLSHNITFLIMVVLYAFYLLFNIKQLLKEKTRIVIIAIIATVSILITCFFTMPMLEQMLSGKHRVDDYFGTSSMSELALKLSSIVDFRTDASNYLTDSVGPFLLFIPLLYPLVSKKNKNTTITYVLLSGYFMIFMTTKLFPWQWVEFLSFMQFPSRVLVPAAAFLALAAGYTVARIPVKKKIKLPLNNILIGSIFIFAILQLYGIYSSPGLITSVTTPEELTDDKFIGREEWYSLLELSTPDYLPLDTNINFRDYKSTIVTNNEETPRQAMDYTTYNNFTFTYPKINEGAYYVIPLTYYKGYVAEIYDGNTLIETVDTYRDPEMGLVRFDPSPYSSDTQEITFKVYYKGTTIQSITAKISWFAFIVYLIVTIGIIGWNSKLVKNILNNTNITNQIKHKQ